MLNATIQYGLTFAVSSGFGTVNFRLGKNQVCGLVSVVVLTYIFLTENMMAFHGTLMNTITRYCLMIFHVFFLVICCRNLQRNLKLIDDNIAYLKEMAAPVETIDSSLF